MEKVKRGTIKNVVILTLLGVALILIAVALPKGKDDKQRENSSDVKEEGQQAGGSINFSKTSGAYEEEFLLELKAGKGTIFYTLDGSNPVDSDTRIEYGEPIAVSDRSGDENIVSAVEPVLFDSVNVRWDEKKKEYSSTVSVPPKEDVDKLTVVKAVVQKEDGSYTAVQTNSYFVGAMTEHIQGIEESCEAAGMDLAVISISMEYADPVLFC